MRASYRTAVARAARVAARYLDRDAAPSAAGRVYRAVANTRSIAARAERLPLRPRFQRQRRHDERPVRPPWPKVRMNLDPERSRRGEAGSLTESLKGKRPRTAAERIQQAKPDIERDEDVLYRDRRPTPREVVQGIWRSVGQTSSRSHRRSKPAKETRPSVCHQDGRTPVGQQLVHSGRAPRDRNRVERLARQRQKDVKAFSGKAFSQRAEDSSRLIHCPIDKPGNAQPARGPVTAG